MCTMTTGECPSSHIPGYQFLTHYDCVNAGYGLAQKTFQGLQELEEFERDYMEREKVAVRFECKEIKTGA